MRFLVIQTAFLGDVILTTPLLRLLLDRHPGSKVWVITTPVGAQALEGLPDVHAIAYDKRRIGLAAGMKRIRAQLGSQGFSGIFCVHRSPRSLWLGRNAKLDKNAIYGRRAFRAPLAKLLGYQTYNYPDYDDGTHYVDKVLTLYPEGRRQGVSRPKPWLAHEDKSSVLLDKPYAVVSPFSNWGTKMWPLERFEELTLELHKRTGQTIVLVGDGGPDLIAAAEKLNHPGVVNLVGRTSVSELKTVIAGASMVVANDSAPIHVAAAFNRPTVAIFGPTVRKWGFFPLSDASVIVEQKGLECRPCSLHGPHICPLTHFRCMRETTVDQVLGAIDKIR